MDADQLRDFVIRPSLTAIGMCSDAAINMLLGTAAQESSMGKYILQANASAYRGGIGIYQMEAKTYDDIWLRQVASSPIMRARIKLFLGYEGKPKAERMVTDLGLATIMSRLYYATIMTPLPLPNDIEGMADYWKKYYNTRFGAGKPEEFIKNYRALVGDN